MMSSIRLHFTCRKVSLRLFLNAVVKALLYSPLIGIFNVNKWQIVRQLSACFHRFYRNVYKQMTKYLYTKMTNLVFPTISTLSATLVTLLEDGH